MKSPGQKSVGQASRRSLTSFIRLSGRFSFRHIPSPGGTKNHNDGNRRDACPTGWSRVCCLAAFCCAVMALRSATNSENGDEILKLNPPHPELPPTFWEQYGAWALLATIALLALASFVVWKWLRPKPPAVLPIEVQARQELAVLRQRSEDGQTLSQVSRVLRHYVVAAFELPSNELVTSEFLRVLAGHEKIGPELAAAVGEFLRRCDEHKFAPFRPPAPLGAAARAQELVELGEVRRAQLREVATAMASGQPPQRA